MCGRLTYFITLPDCKDGPPSPQLTVVTRSSYPLTDCRQRENCASDFWRVGPDIPDRRVFRNKRNRTEGGPTNGHSTSCGSEHRGRACHGTAHNVSC